MPYARSDTSLMAEQDVPSPVEDPADANPPASNPDAPPKKIRSRATTACSTCRARRTRCDGRRPVCGFCSNRGLECHYEHNQTSSASRVEAELAAINRRLDSIAYSLQAAHPTYAHHQQPSPVVDADDQSRAESQGCQAVTGVERSPFQLLVTDCIMEVLGLGPGFARELVRLERGNAPHAGVGHAARLRFVQQQQALAALDAFSAHVHSWYPILLPGFSERYIGVLSGPLGPGSESCLVLSVAAVGALAQDDYALRAGTLSSDCRTDSELYFEAATASLPAVLVDDSIESIQSLVLLSIYYCCLSRPCQAYDYVMIASFKVQNLLKCVDEGNDELYEQAKRCYWAVLLIESELRDQLDMVDSGIWNYDDTVNLPDSRASWQFDLGAGSPAVTTTASPGSIISSALPDSSVSASDKAQAYFLAEIAMRRMLHRCYTAIRRTPRGKIAYAPAIALELETQLDEWQSFLPDAVHFQHLAALEPLSNFLRVQYYCCKISIYWPAVYQCIQDGRATTTELLEHCERFFYAYMQSIPSLLMAVQDCIVNRWTLYATIFMTSMVVIQAAGTPCLRSGCAVDWATLLACLQSTRSVDMRIVQASPSLTLLHRTLTDRLAEAYPDDYALPSHPRP
ncbi:hypothetical protein N657DRAFT_667222 [Parathielavia appendiculata]|uniref:Zn(2)-C6 fungal-type domain-containing protein n=1 Tax=Parathielavia appendiculata TaxID=2587402 RepID=A0AAN6TQK6_9PEZI|nr:hypothetical protein N657DRAFT_667222 [Parathielavia appendiculata]